MLYQRIFTGKGKEVTFQIIENSKYSFTLVCASHISKIYFKIFGRIWSTSQIAYLNIGESGYLKESIVAVIKILDIYTTISI